VTELSRPLALIAELTHRCPLSCPYCSNPLELERASAELDTGTWLRVLQEASALGILHVHFTGGEPMARQDLPQLVRHAACTGLYSNLITSAALLDKAKFDELVAAGLDHVQISFQDCDAKEADLISGHAGSHARKLAASAYVLESGVALTANFVVHRENLSRLRGMIDLGLQLGAGRIEIAHVQYYGWALENRAALLPTSAQIVEATDLVEQMREQLQGRLVIDYVAPDYYAEWPKACMGGWARRFICISPAGKVLPCHAAETLPGWEFPSVKLASLEEIWRSSAVFQRFRGTEWMTEPCRSCARKEIDWAGCRCQAFALTGNAALMDPVCSLSPDRAKLAAFIAEAENSERALRYRSMRKLPYA
jgi:pyrroloquinoline quinone biosynthesis protein E